MQSGDMEIKWSYIPIEDSPGVILQDILIPDTDLGTRPIKTEHSYSLTSDGDSLTDSPTSHHNVDTCGHLQHDPLNIKDEPNSETESNHSSRPSSPQSMYVNASNVPLDVKMSPISISHTGLIKSLTNTLLPSPHTVIPQIPIKIESTTFHNLPPTPPSCSSSEASEDNGTISQPSSPAVGKTAGLLLNQPSTRQPINTSLTSKQRKGSTGILVLTEEEKSTLIAEGYPVPTCLPLTRAEEKSLSRIRRKIKNKICAQQSRRKKKEYMDQLERQVKHLITENTNFRRKIEFLEDSNKNLLSQLEKLQTVEARTHP